jgi:hypothetical protein
MESRPLYNSNALPSEKDRIRTKWIELENGRTVRLRTFGNAGFDISHKELDSAINHVETKNAHVFLVVDAYNANQCSIVQKTKEEIVNDLQDQYGLAKEIAEAMVNDVQTQEKVSITQIWQEKEGLGIGLLSLPHKQTSASQSKSYILRLGQ